MKTTVEISDVLFERAKAVAKQRGTTLRALIESGLTTVLSATKPKAVKPMRTCSFGGAVTFPADYKLPKPAVRDFDIVAGQLVKREH